VIADDTHVRCDLPFAHGRHHTARIGDGHYDWVDGIDRRVGLATDHEHRED
jgi:hypothetical protein